MLVGTRHQRQNDRFSNIQLFTKRHNQVGLVKTESICSRQNKFRENFKLVLGRVENNVGKGENAG